MKNRAFFISSLLKTTLLLLVISCANQNSSTISSDSTKLNKSENKEAQQCICMLIYDPVCSEGKTYGNACEAKCQGIKKYTKGACSL